MKEYVVHFKPKIIIVSGPSGAGKTSICEAIYKEMDCVYRSISITTRKKRNHETEGVHYYFSSEAEFLKKIDSDEFLEYAYVHGNYYGTLKKNIENAFKNKQDCLVEIDVQGAQKIQNNLAYETLSIFIGVSHPDKIRERLLARGSETEEVIQKRMTNMLSELEKKDMYDFYIENISLEDSVNQLKDIILKSRCKGNEHGSF